MVLSNFSIEIKDGRVFIGGRDMNFPNIDEDSFTITKIDGVLCINDYRLIDDTWVKLSRDELRRCRRHRL